MSVATGGAATGVAGLPEVWQWQEQLVGFGTRCSGSSGHAAYVDWLARAAADGARVQDAGRPADTPSHGPASAQIAGVP